MMVDLQLLVRVKTVGSTESTPKRTVWGKLGEISIGGLRTQGCDRSGVIHSFTQGTGEVHMRTRGAVFSKVADGMNMFVYGPGDVNCTIDNDHNLR